jgi:hypothetical protein
MKFPEDFSGEVFCKFQAFRKFPEVHRKVSLKCRVFFLCKHKATERKSLFLLLQKYWGSRKISGKLRGNFRNSENS